MESPFKGHQREYPHPQFAKSLKFRDCCMHTESLFVEVNKSTEFFMAAKKRSCLDLNIKLHDVRESDDYPCPSIQTLIHTKTNATDAINGKNYA